MRFMGGQNHEYLCVETFNCEYSIFYLARQFNERCSAKRARHFDEIHNEVNTVSFTLLPFLKKFIPNNLEVLDLEKMNAGLNALKVDEFKTKFKTIITSHLYQMRTLYHDIAVSQITQANKLSQGTTDNTPLDDPKDPLKEKKLMYEGLSSNFLLQVLKGRVMSYIQKDNVRQALSYNKMLYLASNDYRGIVFDNSNSIVMCFSDNETKYFFEVDTSGKNLLTTNWEKLSQKSQSANEAFGILDADIRNLGSSSTSASSSSSTTSSSTVTTTTITTSSSSSSSSS